MNQKYKYILIDTSNIFHRNYHYLDRTLKDYDKINIYNHTIVAVLKSINKIEREYLSDAGTIYFCFDNPTSKISMRHELSKEYKANRDKMPDEFYESLNHLAIILTHRSDKYKLIRVPFLEADDHLKPLIENIRLNDKVNNILICSGDLDWAKELNKNTYWNNFNDILDTNKFKEKYGYLPTRESITLHKTITGDKSDGILNIIKNLPKPILIHLITTYNDIYSLLSNIKKDDMLSDKWRDRFELNKKALMKNYKLVDYLPCSYEELSDYMTSCKLSIDILKPLYEILPTTIKEVDPRNIFNSTASSDPLDFFDNCAIERY